jgi:hypothetical protein
LVLQLDGHIMAVMLMKRPAHRPHISTAPRMIPDAGPTCRLALGGHGSGEVAADRVLHVQRFALPLGLITVAQPRLGRRPPLATVLTSEHHPPPALDDMAERLRDRVDRPCPMPGPLSCSNRARSASGKATRTRSTRSDSSGPVAGSAPLTMVPRLQTSLPLSDGSCSASLHAALAAARQSKHRATGVESRWPPPRR